MPTTTETAIATSASLLERVVALNSTQAKTVAYWCLATYAVNDLVIFPPLEIYGPLGSGKTTLMKTIRKLCHEPQPIIDGTTTSDAVMRDSLNGSATHFVEEADGINESLILKKFSRDVSAQNVNRSQSRGGWQQERLDLFGPVVLHRRRPFSDPATMSRVITVRTYPSTDFESVSGGELTASGIDLKDLSATIDWRRSEVAQGRVRDAWSPLTFAAGVLGDHDWLGEIETVITTAESHVAQGQQEEPAQKLFKLLLAEAIQKQAFGGRVALSEIVAAAERERMDINPWQAGQQIREYGLEVKSIGGRTWILIDTEVQMREIGMFLGVEDEWITDGAT